MPAVKAQPALPAAAQPRNFRYIILSLLMLVLSHGVKAEKYRTRSHYYDKNYSFKAPFYKCSQHDAAKCTLFDVDIDHDTLLLWFPQWPKQTRRFLARKLFCIFRWIWLFDDDIMNVLRATWSLISTNKNIFCLAWSLPYYKPLPYSSYRFQFADLFGDYDDSHIIVIILRSW